MDAREPQRDPMPNASASIDEIIAFWDTHSTADYEDQTEEVAFDIDLRDAQSTGGYDEPEASCQSRRDLRKT
jgi:hypothetical protein